MCAELLSDGNDFSLDIDVFGAFFTVGECGSILVGCNAVEGVGSGSVAGCLSFFASAGLFSAGGHAVEGVNEGFALCGFRCVSFEVHDRAADDDFVARFDLRVSFGEFFVAEVVGAIDIELVFGGAVIGDVEGGVTIVGGEFLLDGNHDAFDIDSGRVHVSFECGDVFVDASHVEGRSQCSVAFGFGGFAFAAAAFAAITLIKNAVGGRDVLASCESECQHCGQQEKKILFHCMFDL